MISHMQKPEPPEHRTFAVNPKLRCCFHFDDRGSVCAEFALFERRGAVSTTARFFCKAHHRADDVEIRGAQMYRRVHLQVEVYLAGTEDDARAAQRGAYDRVERAVRGIGGALGIIAITSEIGHSPTQAVMGRRVARWVTQEPTP
jgi:hypothetical protein